MNADTLARIRLAVLGLAGLICAAYALLSVLWNTPQPFTWGLSVQFSYWFGIVLFILAAVMVSKGMISQSTGVAAFGTAYGASPMLAFCIISLRS